MVQLSDPGVQEYISDLATKRRVVFIIGCARSGTTILQRCMSTVSDPVYFWSEAPLARLYKERDSGADGRHFVLKRTAKCYENFPHIPGPVKMLHIVRNPEAVFTSVHGNLAGYYVTPERWGAEFEAFLALEKQHPPENLYVVRYEDLMSDPDASQRQIGEHLDLEFDLPFTRLVERNHLDKKIVPKTGEMRRWLPIDPSRTSEKRDLEQIAARMKDIRPALGPKIDAFCEKFGYRELKF